MKRNLTPARRSTTRQHKLLAAGTRGACISEPLERRMLLSFSPVGSEFQVNSFTSNNQTRPAMAMDADGDFVVVWQSLTQDGDNYGIFAKRCNASGGAGSEFRVNTFTTGLQNNPSVAMDADGDFVVAWASPHDGDSYGVFAQRYSAAGAPQGGEFRVNTFTTGNQSAATVAMNFGGDFVVTWISVGQDGSGFGVYAQRFNAAGLKQGGEFRVNTFTTNNQGFPVIAMDAEGDFVIAWNSLNQDGSDYGVYAQRYNASGVAQGAEFRVNTFTTGNQSEVSVDMDYAGNVVMSWSSFQDGSSYGVYAQRYNAAGVPQGTQFQVNSFTLGSQLGSSVSMDADGDFIVTWHSQDQDGSGYGVYAQQYNEAGVPQGSEFRVNTFITNNQAAPAVDMDADGDLVVVWQSFGQDGSGDGIFAQRYDESTDTAGPTIAGWFVNGRQVLPYSVQNGPAGQVVVSFSENVRDTGGPSSVTNPANWRVTHHNGGTTSNVPISGISYFFNAAANRFEATLPLSGSFAAGNLQVIVLDNIRDLPGNALDGNLDGVPGGSTSQTFGIGAYGPRGGEFRVNSFTVNNQRVPAVAMNADGDFVVAWGSYGQDGFDFGIYAQRHNAAGVPQGAEIRINNFSINIMFSPSVAVAMDGDGDFVVAWHTNPNLFTNTDIYARRYNAEGEAQGGAFQVNTFTTDAQEFPAVAMDANGNFVVAWESDQDGSGRGIYAQRYNAPGAPQGAEFRVNSFTTGHQSECSLSTDADGDFVVAWESFQDGSGFGIYGQLYNAAGAPQGAEFRVNSFTTNNQTGSSLSTDADGDFVVAWGSYAQDGSGRGIYAQRYNAAGAPQGAEFRVNSTTTGNQRSASVAMDTDGDFVVAWQSYNQDGSGYGIYAQRYNAAGVTQGAEFRVNSFTPNSQQAPSVAMDAAGNFAVAWQSAIQDGSGDGIYAQRFDLGATPLVGALSDAPDPAIPGAPVTLTASGVSDDVTVLRVHFYREDNGIPGLQFGADGDSLLATDTAAGGGWSAIISTAGIAPGTYTYYAQAADDEGLISEPASTTHTIVNTAPSVLDSEFFFQTLSHKLTFAFDQNVAGSINTDDIVLENLTTSQTIPSAHLAVSYNPVTNTTTFTYTGPGSGVPGALPDGNYRATLLSAGISNEYGMSMAANVEFNFFFLNGDANRDGRVNLADFNILAANFGQNPRNFFQGDFNYDTIVNLSDFNILASRFGQVLAAPDGLSALFGGTKIQATRDEWFEQLLA